jgi:small GTP-binding protein
MEHAAGMIVGTAGHIDHGKTSLVRALTGIETDRLQEERTRGISIELGYAYVPVESTARPAATLGFVDVPGHERFVHTMVAGATGIDVALLVVAADDGVMPQTREHLAILQLLGVDRGAVALTKIDRVDAARSPGSRSRSPRCWPDAAAGFPVFACNSTAPDDAGINALRAHLHAWAAATPARARPTAQRAVPHAGGPRVLAGRPRHAGDRRGAWRRRRGGRAPAADAGRHRSARAQHPRAEPGQRPRHGRAALRVEPGGHRPRRHPPRRLDRRPARPAGHHPRRRAPAAVRVGRTVARLGAAAYPLGHDAPAGPCGAAGGP